LCPWAGYYEYNKFLDFLNLFEVIDISATTLKRILAKFEEFRGIPYVIGSVDGSHITIIAPPIDPTSYYCRKGFYSAFLQGVVDSQCRFWDYDFRWAGRCHDWTLFQNQTLGRG
jgi:hypothetical protein